MNSKFLLTGHVGTAYRGVVVSVWDDPEGNTDRDVLQNLERGTYGPFFGPV